MTSSCTGGVQMTSRFSVLKSKFSALHTIGLLLILAIGILTCQNGKLSVSGILMLCPTCSQIKSVSPCRENKLRRSRGGCKSELNV